MEIKKICVLGAGIMGNGITQICAQAGYEVSMRDIEDKFVQSGLASIDKSLGRLAKAGKIEQGEVEKIKGRIKGIVDLKEAAKDADIVIEAAPEDMDLKKKIFADLDGICPPQTILASNTSGLMITDIASATKRPDKVIGMHWFNPPVIMKLIEIIKGADTSDKTYEVVKDLSLKLGKEPALVEDGPGFFTTRYIMTCIGEGIKLFESGTADISGIDKMCKLAFNWPMGPIKLADFIGLDTVLHTLEYAQQEIGDPKYAPPLTLKKLVKAGYLGRKIGSKGGFYEYFKVEEKK